MRKTNHILHGVLTLVTVGIWGLGWGAITLRNWAYNESRGYNDLKRRGHPVTSSFVESSVRFSGSGSYILIPAGADEKELLKVSHRLATEKSIPLSELVVELGSQPDGARQVSIDGPATFLPKAPRKKKLVTGDVITREFVLDEELMEMFQEIGITDPADMQTIIDLSLADTSTEWPRNRLLLSFGDYAKALIRESGLQIPSDQDSVPQG